MQQKEFGNDATVSITIVLSQIFRAEMTEVPSSLVLARTTLLEAPLTLRWNGCTYMSYHVYDRRPIINKQAYASSQALRLTTHKFTKMQNIHTNSSNHFSGPGRATGWLWVYVCVWTITSELNDLWPRYLTCWFNLTQESPKIKVTSQCSRSQSEKYCESSRGATFSKSFLVTNFALGKHWSLWHFGNFLKT